MLPLKEAIAEKHSLAEKMTFNQRMFNGELSNEEYVLYLSQQLAIFDAIEIHELPHPSLDRAGKVFEDIKELVGEGQIQITPLQSTNEYRKYINGSFMNKHRDQLIYQKPQYECILTLSNTRPTGDSFSFDVIDSLIISSIAASTSGCIDTARYCLTLCKLSFTKLSSPMFT